MSLTTDVLTQAFKEIFYAKTESGNTYYSDRYEFYMGLPKDPPIDPPNPETDPPLPTFDELKAVDSAIASGNLRIGTYPHEPYYFYVEGVGDLYGWELDLAKPLADYINKNYPELDGNFTTNWVEVNEEDFDEPLPWDGSDNDIILKELVKRLRQENPPYDIIFSGIFVKSCDMFQAEDHHIEEDECYDFTERTSEFYLSGVYSGRNNYNDMPAGDLTEIYKFFAEKSAENDDTIIIINTSNDSQHNTGKALAEWITHYGGKAESKDVMVYEIKDLIVYGEVHIYVGDVIQIEVMKQTYSQVTRFDANLLGLKSPDTQSGDAGDFTPGIMDLAPLGLRFF